MLEQSVVLVSPAPLLVGVVFGVPCLLVGGLALYAATGGGDTSDLETVRATVVRSSVKPLGDGSGLYYPDVAFEYRYEGEAHESTTVSQESGEPGGEREAAAEVVDRYAEGETVTAYVDPGAPGEAFLETEDDSSVAGLVVGGFFLLFGSGLLYLALTEGLLG